MVIVNTQVRRNPAQQAANPHDLFRSNPIFGKILVPAEDLCGKTVWEPCAGHFDLVQGLYDGCVESVLGTDIIDHEDNPFVLEQVVDILTVKKPLAKIAVTNPPVKTALMQPIVEHLLSLGLDKLCIFARAAWVTDGDKRSRWLRATAPARVHFIPQRYRFRWNDIAIPGGGYAFCWVVWEKNHAGPCVMDWLDAR